jgi:uncharacterized protein YndB with AHSA1/START domain/uncharacterized damage-inducible protein DinB
MSETRYVERGVIIETTPDLAFEAVTKASELREWCSDEAWTEVYRGGRYELRWNSGYRMDGKFVELNAPRHAAVTWRGTAEPGETAVEFQVEPTADGVEVKLIHRGFGPGADWDRALAASERGWAVGLENLKSTLETGVDLRIARRPFLGIHLDLLTPERAAKEGIAAEQGIYVLDTVEGSGARAAGLTRGDVILALGGVETSGFNELGTALSAHQSGDVVAVELVRGQKRETLQVTLGARPQEEMPGTLEALVERLVKRHKEINADLQAAVEGLTDVEAEQRPAEGEWSVKEVLAHLSSGMREFQTFLIHIAVNGWLDSEPFYPDQMPGQMGAVLAVTPTLMGLVDRLFQDELETEELVHRLPERTVAHKARFRRIAQNVLYYLDHICEHIAQIKKNIEILHGG